MNYTTDSLKIALGMSVLENKKLDRFQKMGIMEFIHNGTDAQIRHLALTGEVKYKFTLAEKDQLAKRIQNVTLSESLQRTLQELSKEDIEKGAGEALEKGKQVYSGAKKVAGEYGQAAMKKGEEGVEAVKKGYGAAKKAAGEHGAQAVDYVAKKAQAAKDFADQHTGGHGTAAMAAGAGVALAGGAAALIAKRRAQKKAEAAAKAKAAVKKK